MPFQRLLFRRDHDRPDVVGADGHRAEIFRHGSRPHEYRLGLAGDRFAAVGRLRDRRDRELVSAVPDVDGPVAARRLLRVPDAPGNTLEAGEEMLAAGRPVAAE
jgi:hypothetical protein